MGKRSKFLEIYSKMTLLTKSNYLLGLQCPKFLWITKNDKKRIPEPDVSAKHNFKVGTLIGVLATKVFENGIDLSELDFKENLAKTKEAIKERKTIFLCQQNNMKKKQIFY